MTIVYIFFLVFVYVFVGGEGVGGVSVRVDGGWGGSEGSGGRGFIGVIR